MVENLLTIDFDFFVPEDPMWDLGHIESPFFIHHIWHTRAMLVDEIKMDGRQEDFWEKIQESFKLRSNTLLISESHLEAFALTHPRGLVVNIDRHHDCWKGEKNIIACDTWGFQAFKLRYLREMVWVAPDDLDTERMGYPPIPSDLNVKTLSLEAALKEFEGETFDDVHVCRSGAWVPPWLDKDFAKFICSGPFSEHEEIGSVSVEPRWSEKDLEQAIAFRKHLRERLSNG